jgi:biopolymer transport protein ExbD
MKPKFSRSLRPSDTVDPPELDVTPIMNMFIILIPFLVSMAVFTHLSVLHFSLPPNAGSGLSDSSPKPKLKITVVIAESHLAITHGEMMLDSITCISGNYDITLLTSRLRAYRTQKAFLNDEVVVAVRNSIPFNNVVKVMDVCRTVGFTRIGLSNATEDPTRGV